MTLLRDAAVVLKKGVRVARGGQVADCCSAVNEKSNERTNTNTAVFFTACMMNVLGGGTLPTVQ